MITKNERKYLYELGQRIKQTRLDKGIQQIELAVEINMEKSNLSRIEAGRTNPTILSLKKIATALEIEVSELLKGIE